MDHSILNTLFKRISKEKENIKVFEETLENENFCGEVIEILWGFDEDVPELFWWQYQPLMYIFNRLYKKGGMLPDDAVERLRWVALLCLQICETYDYPPGKIIRPPDYLPDEELKKYAGTYGDNVVEAITKIRKRLEWRGWREVFGE